MVALSQDTITQAGLASKPADMVASDVMSAYSQKGAALKGKKEAQDEAVKLDQEKAAALAPKLDAAAEDIQKPPPDAPTLEKSPDYKRPTVTPKELQDSFGMLLAASMLVGVGSRAPFYAAMQGMTGAMQGFQAKDEELVKESLNSFNANVTAIKERNDAARQEFEDAWRKYSTQPARMQQEIQILGAKYDLPLAAKNARVASYDSAIKEFDNTIKSGETTLIKLQQLAEKAQNDADKLTQHKEDMQLRRDIAGQAHSDRMAMMGGGAVGGDSTKTGEEYLATVPPAERGLVKGIAEGRMNPSTLSTRGGQRERVMSMVMQYKPDYDQQEYGVTGKTERDFATGKQGNSVRAFNVALEHLDTLKGLGEALDNGNVQVINKIANTWKTETGSPGPTNFNGAKQLVADEVVKAIVGSGGGVADREEAAKTIAAASSPRQLSGIIKTYQQLFDGQLKGLEKQYESGTGKSDFRSRYLTPRGEREADGGSDGGWSVVPDSAPKVRLIKRGGQ